MQLLCFCQNNSQWPGEGLNLKHKKRNQDPEKARHIRKTSCSFLLVLSGGLKPLASENTSAPDLPPSFDMSLITTGPTTSQERDA
eukprot:1140320-Pelagomonas_calceolata.AAC.3